MVNQQTVGQGSASLRRFNEVDGIQPLNKGKKRSDLVCLLCGFFRFCG